MVNITKSAAERDKELYGKKEGFEASWRRKTKKELEADKKEEKIEQEVYK